MIKKFVQDFLVGGSLVAFALGIAYLTTPIIGGIIAAIPIRLAITLGLIGHREGVSKFEQVAKGSVIGMLGNLCFTITLFVSLVSLGLALGFLLAIIICLFVIIILTLISKSIFPK